MRFYYFRSLFANRATTVTTVHSFNAAALPPFLSELSLFRRCVTIAVNRAALLSFSSARHPSLHFSLIFVVVIWFFVFKVAFTVDHEICIYVRGDFFFL